MSTKTTLLIHRKEQDDIGVIPWVCVHANDPERSVRVLCVSAKGIEIDPLLHGLIATGSISKVEVDPTMQAPDEPLFADTEVA
jgi:hypothetical protein